MTRPAAAPFVTSIRIDRDGGGPHEWVTIYIRGQNVGTLCVGRGDGDELERMLLAPPDTPETAAAKARAARMALEAFAMGAER